MDLIIGSAQRDRAKDRLRVSKATPSWAKGAAQSPSTKYGPFCNTLTVVTVSLLRLGLAEQLAVKAE
jgi:hypothetical protein